MGIADDAGPAQVAEDEFSRQGATTSRRANQKALSRWRGQLG